MRNPFIKFALIGLAAFSSCKSSEKNGFTGIKNHDSKEFKNKLAEKIKADDGKLIYRFNSYKTKGTTELIDVDIVGADFDVTTAVLVDNWDKLSQIRAKKGRGYSGAELKGFKLTIEDNAEGAVFKYKDVEEVVD